LPIARFRPRLRQGFSLLLILSAFFLAYHAVVTHRQLKTFQNPVAYTFLKDVLYVVEKERNTVVALKQFAVGQPMTVTGIYEIEPDDPEFYFMVRHVYPGPEGLVAQSQIYRKGTQEFIGYRFSEYPSLKQPPKPLLTFCLEKPNSNPWIYYTFDPAGHHFFANNCERYHNIWKLPPSGGITIKDGKVPGEVQSLGQINRPLDEWEAIAVGPQGQIFLTSGASGKIVQYNAKGKRLREFGEVGFGEGKLLAPGKIFFAHLNRGEPDALTAASKGNRSWVQFDMKGRTIRSIFPLNLGYPHYDILVGAFYYSASANRQVAFDLANKTLILFDGKGFATSKEYIVTDWSRTIPRLVLAGLILLAGLFFHGILAFMTKLRITFFVKILVLVVPLLMLSAYIVGESIRTVMQQRVTVESIRRSANLAQAVINNLALNDLKKIHRAEDRESPAYERIHRTISRIVNTEAVEQTPKWILHKIHHGRYYFGINNWRSAIFDPFVVPSDRPMFRRVLVEKTPQNGRFTDDQGEWFSYLCPVLDTDGRPIYVLELYRPAEQLDRAGREASQKALKIMGATVLAAILLVFFFSFIFTRPLRKLIKKTTFISKGDFDQEIGVRSRDEIGDLAQAFDKMVADLKKYIAELARTTAEKESIQSELRLAHEMQQGILPTVFPPYPQAENIAIFAQMLPAREVGGDFYDFFPVDDDHLGVVVGDVSGKGLPAGLFMMRVHAMLRSTGMGRLSPAEVLSRINQVIGRENPSATFATLFYLVCNIRTGGITYCNAGHNRPLRIKDGQAQPRSPSPGHGRGLPIGAMNDGLYKDGTLSLGAGESLMIYTDGATDACNPQNEMFGEERLRETVQAHAQLEPEPLCRRIFSEIQGYQADAEQFDDIAVLIFKFGGGLTEG
jgi:serine phosphatase RsbU (regulator of sigma subunit)